GRRTAWSRRGPQAPIGDQNPAARAAVPRPAGGRSRTSRALPRASSPRPYPPTPPPATPPSPPRHGASPPSPPAARRPPPGAARAPLGAGGAASPARPARRRPGGGPRRGPPTRCPAVPQRRASEGPRPALSGAAPHPRVHRSAPDLAVADPPRLRGLDHDADQV